MNTKQLAQKFKKASTEAEKSVERSALQVSVAMVGYAKQNAHVITGNMRNSIVPIATSGFIKEGDKIIMGAKATASYSIFEEYGVGPKGDPEVPHTTKTRWWYWDETMVNEDGSIGGFRMGVTREAHRFMRPALKDHIGEYGEIIAGNLKEVLE